MHKYLIKYRRIFMHKYLTKLIMLANKINYVDQQN